MTTTGYITINGAVTRPFSLNDSIPVPADTDTIKWVVCDLNDIPPLYVVPEQYQCMLVDTTTIDYPTFVEPL